MNNKLNANVYADIKALQIGELTRIHDYRWRSKKDLCDNLTRAIPRNRYRTLKLPGEWLVVRIA